MKVHRTPNMPLYIERGLTRPKTKYTGENNSSRPCIDKTIITNETPSVMGPTVGPISVHNHQAAASLLSLPLLGVLTSAHINKIDDHRKGGKPHTIIQPNERVS